jgi:3-oxoacyl-[acyl-carrier protein] reductase
LRWSLGSGALACARRRQGSLGRPGRAEEFANLACFLASDAGSYITGTAINVDGGMSRVV